MHTVSILQVYTWNTWYAWSPGKGKGSLAGHRRALKRFGKVVTHVTSDPSPWPYPTTLVSSVNSKCLWHTDLIRLRGQGSDMHFNTYPVLENICFKIIGGMPMFSHNKTEA